MEALAARGLGWERVASDAKLGAAGAGITLDNNGALRASASFASARNVALTGAGGVFQVADELGESLRVDLAYRSA
jgi:hypothetical protein